MRRLLRESGYALGAFPLGLVAFVVVTTGVSLGLGLLVLGVGLVVMVGTVHALRGIAFAERLRMRALLGRAAPAPTYVVPAAGAGWWQRRLVVLRDPQSWLDLVWGVAGFVTGTTAFSIVVSWWAGALGGLTYWFWQQWLPDPDLTLGLFLSDTSQRAAWSVVYGIGGLLLVATLPWAVRFAVTVHAGVSSALLCSRAELQGEVRRIAGGRDAARDADAASLRRLERDIHDGPQQRLVRLTMDLGRARAQLGDAPGPVGETLDAAMGQARETLAELRSLSRGIAPPLLVDRGLAAALRELTQRSDVPVSLEVDLGAAGRELAPHVETALYFVVSEALTNVNKHSGADTAEVAVVANDAGVVAAVRDDGRGGAAVAKGSGLAGLERRLTAVDGRLSVDSPEGGGTTLSAVVPTPR